MVSTQMPTITVNIVSVRLVDGAIEIRFAPEMKKFTDSDADIYAAVLAQTQEMTKAKECHILCSEKSFATKLKTRTQQEFSTWKWRNNATEKQTQLQEI